MNRNLHLLAGLALAVSSIACSGTDATTGNPGSSLSSDATLSALTVSAGSLTPAFARGTSHYTLAVAFNTPNVMVTPTASDANAQRDVAVTFAHIADVYRRSNDPRKALAALRQGEAIMDRLTKLSPDNAAWKGDLSWFNKMIAAAIDASRN